MTFEVIDAGNNTVTCSFDVTVIDDQLPTITCPNDTVVNAQAGVNYNNFVYSDPVFTDNCSVDLYQLQGLASGAEFTIGDHIIEYYAIDASGNTDTCSYMVTVLDVEDPTIFVEDIIACEGYVEVPLPDVWDNSGGELIITNSIDGDEDASGNYIPGVYNVDWTVMDESGNISTYTSVVDVWAMPEAPDAGPDQALYFKYETFLEGNEYLTDIGTWNIIQGPGNLSDETLFNTEITGLDFGVSVLTWTVDNGVCPAQTDTMMISVNRIFVPNAISPDGDGLNDELVIEGITDFENDVIIYNRWGKIMYETSNYQNDWDGRGRNGKLLPQDTYYYVVRIQGVNEYSGFLVIKY